MKRNMYFIYHLVMCSKYFTLCAMAYGIQLFVSDIHIYIQICTWSVLKNKVIHEFFCEFICGENLLHLWVWYAVEVQINV